MIARAAIIITSLIVAGVFEAAAFTHTASTLSDKLVDTGLILLVFGVIILAALFVEE